VDGAVLTRYEEAADVAGDRYGANANAKNAAEDLWRVKDRVGRERARLGQQERAEAAHQVALSVARQQLQAHAEPDEWLDNAASSYSGLAEVAELRQDWPRAMNLRQSAVDLSARRGLASRESSHGQKDHWLRLYYLSKSQQAADLPAPALVPMTQAVDLARRFSTQFPQDVIWLEYRWFGEHEVGQQREKQADLPGAAEALAAAAAVAEAMVTKAPQRELLWWKRCAESFEALGKVLRRQGLDAEARKALSLANQYRSQVREHERTVGASSIARNKLGAVLSDLALTEEQAERLSKSSLVERLQERLEATFGQAREQGINRERSEQIQRLQSALFAVRGLPD
jgi:tetratricopeptide (TPR) repeat protein